MKKWNIVVANIIVFYETMIILIIIVLSYPSQENKIDPKIMHKIHIKYK